MSMNKETNLTAMKCCYYIDDEGHRCTKQQERQRDFNTTYEHHDRFCKTHYEQKNIDHAEYKAYNWPKTAEDVIKDQFRKIRQRLYYTLRYSYPYEWGHYEYVKERYNTAVIRNARLVAEGQPEVGIPVFYQKVALFHYAHVTEWYELDPQNNTINSLKAAEANGAFKCSWCDANIDRVPKDDDIVFEW